MRRLIAKLGLTEFKNTGPLIEYTFAPRKVDIPLKQHAGAPALPVIKCGDRVRQGICWPHRQRVNLVRACMPASMERLG